MADINKLTQYLKDSRVEMKKVTWPTKKELKNHTILVVAISLGVAAFLGIVDYALNLGLEQFIALK